MNSRLKYALSTLVLLSFSSFSQKLITSIPFELYGDHIFIKASVDDSEPLDMIFDTGSGITVIDRDIADQLHLVQRHVVLNEGSVKGSLIKHNKIEINDYQMEENINVYSTDLLHLEISIGREFDGIVGYDFIRHHNIKIDYNTETLEVYESGDSPTLGQAIPIKLVNAIPTIEGSVVLNNNEQHDGVFFLMTGAGTSLDFNAPYALKYDVIHKTGDHYSYPVKSISKDESLEYEGYIKSLSFGNQELIEVPIAISQAKKGIHSDKNISGIIGNKILRQFNITYDYSENMIYVIRNRSYGDKIAINCSGLDVQLSEDKKSILIHYVIDKSPASEAGIEVNSELLKINGLSMSEVNLATVKELLKQPGQLVDLVIKQGGIERNFSINLRPLLVN